MYDPSQGVECEMLGCVLHVGLPKAVLAVQGGPKAPRLQEKIETMSQQEAH
jgi:hypothetical protein